MTETLLRLTPGRLNRRNSSKSLAMEVESSAGFLPRKDSTTSLKTLRSLGSPEKEGDYEEISKHLSLKRKVGLRLSSLFEGEGGLKNMVGSVTSLKNLERYDTARKESKDSTPSKDSEDAEEEESNIHKTLKKRISRRLSSFFDGGTSTNDDRCSSEPSSPLPLPPPRRCRPVQRSDLPICWLEVCSPSPPTPSASPDLVTRLASRVYTRHLARAILLLLPPQVLSLTVIIKTSLSRTWPSLPWCVTAGASSTTGRSWPWRGDILYCRLPKYPVQEE